MQGERESKVKGDAGVLSCKTGGVKLLFPKRTCLGVDRNSEAQFGS